MKLIYTIIITIVILSNNLIADVKSKEMLGYGKTTWGMKSAEVLKAEEPRAVIVENPSVYTGELEGDSGKVKIKNIEICSQKFDIIFIFDKYNDELKQVNVTCLEKKNYLIHASTFKVLEKLLIGKYGTPFFRENGEVVSWKGDSTLIELHHFNIDNVITKFKQSSSSNS